MTPLGHQVLKQLLLPVKRRSFIDDGVILPRMDGVHYFDCRSVGDVAFELAYDKRFDDLREKTAFLPAAKTWIEVKKLDMDVGFLLIADNDRVKVWSVVRGVDAAFGGKSRFRSSKAVQNLEMRNSRFGDFKVIDFSGWRDVRGLDDIVGDYAGIFAPVLISCLALINSPRAVDRRLNEPHAGLRRQLERMATGEKQFRVHRWTKILLELEPRSFGGSPSEGAVLIGTRAKHFVRQYLRTRNGELERVSEHWKGDAALGLKLSTYRVAAPRIGEDK